MTDAGAPRGAARRAVWIAAGALLAAAVLAACRSDRGTDRDTDRSPAAASDTVPRLVDGAGSADSTATDSAPPPEAAPTADASAPPEVFDFIAYVEAQRATDSAGVARGYAAEGLRLLAASIEALAARDTTGDTTRVAAVRPRLGLLRARADSVRNAEAEPLARARLASESFLLAGDLLQTLQEGVGRPALTDRAAEARQAAAAVRADQPLTTQSDAVRRFFERSAAALRGMIGARPS